LKSEKIGSRMKWVYDSIDSSLLKKEEDRSLSLNYRDGDPEENTNQYNIGSWRRKRKP